MVSNCRVMRLCLQVGKGVDLWRKGWLRIDKYWVRFLMRVLGLERRLSITDLKVFKIVKMWVFKIWVETTFKIFHPPTILTNLLEGQILPGILGSTNLMVQSEAQGFVCKETFRSTNHSKELNHHRQILLESLAMVMARLRDSMRPKKVDRPGSKNPNSSLKEQTLLFQNTTESKPLKRKIKASSHR